jgi:hypothetical protein
MCHLIWTIPRRDPPSTKMGPWDLKERLAKASSAWPRCRSMKHRTPPSASTAREVSGDPAMVRITTRRKSRTDLEPGFSRCSAKARTSSEKPSHARDYTRTLADPPEWERIPCRLEHSHWPSSSGRRRHRVPGRQCSTPIEYDRSVQGWPGRSSIKSESASASRVSP